MIVCNAAIASLCSASGSAVYNDSGCTLTLENCTFAGNSANGGAGGNDPSFGGGNGGAASAAGIFNLGTLTATSCTFSIGKRGQTNPSNPKVITHGTRYLVKPAR